MSGRIFEKLNNDSAALDSYSQSVGKIMAQGNLKDLAGAYNGLASSYGKISRPDSAIYYANKALILDEQNKFNDEKAETYLNMSKIYEKVNPGKAFEYYKLAISTRDGLFSQEKQRQVSSFKFNEELRQNELLAAEREYKSSIRTYILAGLLVFFLAFMIVLFRNNRQQQRAKTEVEKAYGDLKSTQAQLIQSEKMASLGELTAGIAHEIQNPLNFVNNFSEVNSELIDEAAQANDAGKPNEVKELLSTLKGNEEKIIHHGKRADNIVKGMLQHSRSSSSVKEPTDINALADEYLRLSYHGLRAKDNSFNAIMKTDFDESISNINIIPQDIGRVLLNLYNNAFYAVTEKKRQHPSGYEPTVSVSTKKTAEKIEIRVKDNGNGIPQKVVDKIFQPFFTTKPTGVGTGLGLSLSYDIVKAHGGEINVNTIEGEFTEFVIQLPIST